MRTLRILQVTPYYREAWGYGGIPRVVGGLSRALARRGHRITVFTTDARDSAGRLPAGPTADPDGVQVRVFPNLSNTLAYHAQLFLPDGMRAALEREVQGFDVAHVHGCHHLPGVFAADALRRAAVPWVLTPNGTLPRIERRQRLKWLFDHTLGRSALVGASRFLAVSPAEHRQFRRLGLPEARIREIPNPVPTQRFADLPARGTFRRRHGLPFDRFVLYLGKLTPRKGVVSLVRAFARLEDPTLGLVILGNDMGAGARIRRAVRRDGLGARVRMPGPVVGSERLEALADAALVVYPGRDEIFWLVPLEALLCRTPVVVANDSGCGEVIARVAGGVRVPPGDIPALTEALRRLLAPGAPAVDVEAARASVVALYDESVVATQLEQVYLEVVR